METEVSHLPGKKAMLLWDAQQVKLLFQINFMLQHLQCKSLLQRADQPKYLRQQRESDVMQFREQKPLHKLGAN